MKEGGEEGKGTTMAVKKGRLEETFDLCRAEKTQGKFSGKRFSLLPVSAGASIGLSI